MTEYGIVNGQVYLEHHFAETALLLSGGKLHICREGELPDSCRRIDAAGGRVVPGFIDIHTHGAVGADVNGADKEGLKRIGRFFAGNGTTSWLASVLTDTREQTVWCIDQCKGVDQSGWDMAQLLGIHLEGPFLAGEYKGAMPEQLLQTPCLELIGEYQQRAGGKIRYMTVSPELPGTLELIPEWKKLGIVIAMGHSGADYETAWRAIEAGVSASTHTFNAMRLLHQHRPAILGAALESDIYCEMICDGFHLHPGIVRLLLKTKGADRLVGITDSIMAAGLPDGICHLGVNEVIVENGDARLVSDGTRAGSTLTQIRALRNMLHYTGRPLEEILPIFTENPAKLIGVWEQKGSIAEGKDADLVILDENMEVRDVFLRGKRFADRKENV